MLTKRGAGWLIIAAALWIGGIITAVSTAWTFAAVMLAAFVACAVLTQVVVRAANATRTVRTPLPIQRGEAVTIDAAVLPRWLTGLVGTATSAGISTVQRFHRRGHHELPVIVLQAVDPLGLTRARRTVDDGATITVTPRLLALGRLTSGTGADGDSTASVRTGRGDASPLPRPSEPGDDIRRIHWKATARAGTLMSREEERPESTRVLILADTAGHAVDSTPGPATEGEQAEQSERAEQSEQVMDAAVSLERALRTEGAHARIIQMPGESSAPITGAPAAATPPVTADRDALLIVITAAPDAETGAARADAITRSTASRRIRTLVILPTDGADAAHQTTRIADAARTLLAPHPSPGVSVGPAAGALAAHAAAPASAAASAAASTVVTTPAVREVGA